MESRGWVGMQCFVSPRAKSDTANRAANRPCAVRAPLSEKSSLVLEFLIRDYGRPNNCIAACIARILLPYQIQALFLSLSVCSSQSERKFNMTSKSRRRPSIHKYSRDTYIFHSINSTLQIRSNHLR